MKPPVGKGKTENNRTRPGDRVVAIVKNGTLQYVPVRPMRETKGMIPGLDSKDLRDAA